MARPTKNFCDYFPHDRDMRNHRKVKAIRTKFGINGYAIWSMILEYLTGIDGNVFEYSDVEFELMGGDFGVSATEIRCIVDYCIILEMLFLENSFIRSESLDERLKPVYDKRQVSKGISKKQSRVNGKFTANNTESLGVSVAEMPQSKVNRIKVKNKEIDKESSGRMKRPSQEEVCGYFLEKNSNDIEAAKFFNFYESKGWKVGKTPMVNWKSAASGWLTRNNSTPIARGKTKFELEVEEKRKNFKPLTPNSKP